ncbi:hypothetical protein [Methylobacterium gossipiicola]|uniref:hypothetical protein n=1 Tax=Methylobacterium gossipiicola TaxID=582675 RepID=UPI00116088C1|nr:hypothetical protein [Methylobacterium gossipiicola]
MADETLVRARPEGPDPPTSPSGRTPSFDAGTVEEWTVIAWRADRRAKYEGFETTAGNALSWPDQYLPTAHPMRSEARNFLLMWAWCEAGNDTWRGYCRKRGWSRTTADRWRKWAAEQIAAGINEAIRRATRAARGA